MGVFKDISGLCFGQLMAIQPFGRRRSSGDITWLCHCDCGAITIVSSTNLRSGNT